MLSALIDLLAPAACAACRRPGGRPLCGPCRTTLVFLDDGPRCPRCALPAPCGRGRQGCPAGGAAWTRAWAPVAYAGSAPALVGALKFRGALPCARLMAAQIVAGAPPGLLDGAALVPVPTDGARARARGYDQAVVLAGALGARSGRPVQAGLRRCGPAARQVGAGREARLAAGRLQMRWTGPTPGVVVLVDDVHTTGATLRAAAAAMAAAGAPRIAAVTWARTL